MSAEGEHQDGDEGFGVSEAEGHAGAESDFEVDGFGSSVGQAVLDGDSGHEKLPGDGHVTARWRT